MFSLNTKTINSQTEKWGNEGSNRTYEQWGNKIGSEEKGKN